MTIANAPLSLIRRMEKRWPGCFRLLEESISGTPGISVREAAAHLLVFRYGLELHIAEYESAALAGAYLWRQRPNVYRFFGAFSASLNDFCDTMSATDALPVPALSGLPAPCIYLFAPDVFSSKADGCFCFSDIDTAGEPVLYLVFLLSSRNCFPVCIHLKKETAFTECIPSMEELVHFAVHPASYGNEGALLFLAGAISARKPYDCPVHNALLRVVQHCLYLTSVNADIASDASDPSDGGVSFFDVGFNMEPPELEPQNRESGSGDGAGGSKRAHMRRAHWHNYWIKNENGEKVLTPKWIAAVYVSSSGEGG